ncbi:uncharacterized protein LOC120927788 isoform X3 [Rana temporaria]|uniref:uncharacterized protein LOC120927788 isoform X3 n=1 Tax=Rana temporaria TaxID=8407 RepID=UPI001AACA9B3|nr:uncharacterized protein LOC120927788 isoform X3 [Rana temporaria]
MAGILTPDVVLCDPTEEECSSLPVPVTPLPEKCLSPGGHRAIVSSFTLSLLLHLTSPQIVVSAFVFFYQDFVPFIFLLVMALPDTERRSSGWKCSKTALQEEDAINLVKQFAELKRKERENDPEVKRVKNKYKLRASAYASPCNILHTGRQSPCSPGLGLLPLLPSQKCEPQDPGNEPFKQSSSFPVKKMDNLVPSGGQLPHTPSSTEPKQCHVLREIQPNVSSLQELSQTVHNSSICNTAVIISNVEDVKISDPLKDPENAIPMSKISAHTVMALPDTERRSSGWKCSKTALEEEDAMNLLKEFAELKRKERENDPEVKRVKNKYKLRASAYPSPGNVLHTGRQLPRSPAPGVLPLLPSQKYKPREPEYESSDQFSFKDMDNIVPSGRQLPRSPLLAEPEQCHVLGGIHPNIQNVTSMQELSQTVNSPGIRSNEEDLNMPDTLEDLEKRNPLSKISAHKETTEEVKVSSQTHNIRRISELPVQGLNQMRISGVLEKMPGYECRSEDLEFLTYMKAQEKAKVLKAELLCLQKDLAATTQDKELVNGRKDKIEEDIRRMKLVFKKTLKLGRAFLSRTGDAASVQGLTPEDVFKQLKHLTIQSVHQQEKAQLLAAKKEVTRRREETASETGQDTKSLLISKIESYEKRVNTAEESLQRLNDEIITLKTQSKKTEEKKSELAQSVQKMREQISQCLEQSAPPTQTDLSEEDRERMNRRLQRILHRKKLYLERERILQKLKRDLK